MPNFNKGGRAALQNEFIAKFSLNEDSANLLRAVHNAVQDETMASFSPKGTKSANVVAINKTFQSFCRSKTVTFFAKEWNLSQQSTDLLFSAHPDVQITIMSTFQPKRYSAGEDVNALFSSFASSIMRKHQVGEMRPAHEVAAPQVTGRNVLVTPQWSSRGNVIFNFCRTWGLDPSSRQALKDCPHDIADGVMADFNPHHTNADGINEKFIAFLNSRLSPVPLQAHGTREFARKWALPPDCIAMLGDLPLGTRTSIMAEFEPRSGHDVVKNFVAFVNSRREQSPAHFIKRFGLHEKAQAQLLDLDPAIQKSVMEEFAPNDLEHVSAKFISFAKSMSRRVLSETAPQKSQPKLQPVQVQQMPRGGKGKPAKFCARWGLDETCMERLTSLPPEVRAQVMEEFDPKERNTDNLSPLFMSFVRSRGAKPNAGHRAEPSRVLERSQLNAVGKFVQQHGLNEKSSSLLQSMTTDDQNLVMVHFDAGDAVDVNDRFFKFCTRKAKRMREENVVRNLRPRRV